MHKLQLFGRIQTRNYDDKDGKKVYVTEVIGEEVYFAGGTGNSSNAGGAVSMSQAPAQHFSSQHAPLMRQSAPRISTRSHIP